MSVLSKLVYRINLIAGKISLEYLVTYKLNLNLYMEKMINYNSQSKPNKEEQG